MRASDGKKLFGENENEKLIPASTLKVLTSAAILHYFSPYEKIKTKFYYTKTLTQGVITGDLYAVGNGDPCLISENLWQIASDLKNMGIKKILGQIVIDQNLFIDPFRDSSRISYEEKSTNAYDAPISAFGVNFNTLAVAVAPAEKMGQKALVHLDPYPVDEVYIENSTVTVSHHEGTKLSIERIKSPQGIKLLVSGKISSKDPIKKFYRSIIDPTKTPGNILKAFLLGQGIAVQGKTTSGKLPPDAKELLTHESIGLGRMVEDLLNFSNNYIADVFLNKLSAEKGTDRQGSFQGGVNLLKKFLQNEIALKEEPFLVDGSGLSRKNRVSAADLAHILVYMSHRFDLFSEFLGAFPIAGKTGSLKDRFTQGQAKIFQGNLRAKTGTLPEGPVVCSLAGYFMSKTQGLIVFAIIQNGKPEQKQLGINELHLMQEEALVEQMKYL